MSDQVDSPRSRLGANSRRVLRAPRAPRACVEVRLICNEYGHRERLPRIIFEPRLRGCSATRGARHVPAVSSSALRPHTYYGESHASLCSPTSHPLRAYWRFLSCAFRIASHVALALT